MNITDLLSKLRTDVDHLLRLQNGGPGTDADTLDGRHAGNASGNVPISNGTKNVDLNADTLEGAHLVNGQAWTPVWTNLGGTLSTNSGVYFTLGNLVMFTITLQGTNIASTLGTTYFALPFAAGADNILQRMDINDASISMGHGLIRAGGVNIGYTPTWAATGDWMIISGWYWK